MENKARYTIVGFFVLTFFIAMIAFVLWLARYSMQEETLKEYRLYVTKSIAGLKEKSVVYYKGLEIGNVTTIRINPSNLEEIEIIMSITQPNLVKVDTVAKIESQGVTGNKIIELEGGTQNSLELAMNEKGYAVIPIQKTFLDNITDNATNITNKADIFLEKLNTLFNTQNIQGIETLINNANESSKQFNALTHQLNTFIAKDIKQSLEHINTISNSIHTMSSNVNEVIQNDVKNILQEFKQTTQSAQNIDEVMAEFENTLLKLNQTLDTIKYDSSNMIFNQRQIKYGPGESPVQ